VLSLKWKNLSSVPMAKNPYDIAKELNVIMSTYVGIFREEGDLKTGIEKLEELKKTGQNG
jgi:succinate dehydrogenase/fumarate reductase flavoprotein subunit